MVSGNIGWYNSTLHYISSGSPLLYRGNSSENIFNSSNNNNSPSADKTFRIALCNTNIIKIQFFIEGVRYFADVGMTWEEWVNSPYNTIGAIYCEDSWFGSDDCFIHVDLEGCIYEYLEGYPTRIQEKIHRNGSYTCDYPSE